MNSNADDSQQSSMSPPRIEPTVPLNAQILHVDMDSFFASVEVRDRPELVGQPVVVAGGGPRGVVAAASYPARKFGIRSAMATARARQLCASLVVVEPNGEKYLAASRQVMDILQRFTPVIEQVSVDEAFMDLGSVLHFGKSATEIAREIKVAVQREVGLTCSIGVATNKTVAKIASAHYKPDGLTVVSSAQTQEFLRPRPIRHLSGVGPSLGERMVKLGIVTIGDLADIADGDAVRLFGAGAATLQRRARGLDAVVKSTSERDKSMSAERTFDQDLSDPEQLRTHLSLLSDRVSSRLRQRGFSARTIAIKVKSSGGQTFNRSHTLPQGTNTTRRVFETASELLTVMLQTSGVRPIRLLGLRAEGLNSLAAGSSSRYAFERAEHSPEPSSEKGSGVQGDLFSGVAAELGDGAAWRDLDDAVDQARSKFGKLAVKSASSLSLTRGGTVTKQGLGAEVRGAKNTD